MVPSEVQAVLDAFSDLILLIEIGGTVRAVNRAGAKNLGYSAAALVGLSLFDLTASPVERAREYLRRCAGSRQPVPGALTFRRKDGSHLECRGDGALVTAVTDTGGVIILRCRAKHDALARFTLLNRQISELSREVAARRRAEDELRTLNNTLEQRVASEIAARSKAEEAVRRAQKMEAIGQLTGGIAHDFNNLLTAIGGNIETLQRRLRAPELEPLLCSALRGVTRAATLTHQLLAFARQQPLAPKPTDLNKLIGETADLLRRTLPETITVEAVLAGGLWRSSVDATELESALLNLAINARDAMPGGGRLTLETANTHLDELYAAMHSEVTPGHYVVIAVTDTGIGMTQEVTDKAFEPFFTTKDLGKGTGLGLSQVYGFVKQSGGHVKIYSEPGQGTTVKLFLPRLLAAETPAETAVPREIPRGTANEVILVVEDDPAVRAYSADTLRELGYSVLEAGDAAAALRVIDSGAAIDLLFTDVGLPGGLDGRQLADEARRRRPGLKSLFTTGYARNAIVHQGRLDPDVELIAKPFTYEGLAARIRSVLKGQAQRGG